MKFMHFAAFTLLAFLPGFQKAFAQAESVTIKRGGLVHTRMLTSLDGEFDELTKQLAGVAKAHDATLADVAKLNLYVSKPEAIAEVLEAFQKTWPKSGKQPALTIIPTQLPAGAQLAGDAVISVKASDATKVERFGRDSSLLPANHDVVYISGRAASGEVAEATAGTMAQLFDVLKHLDAGKENVVQVKAFIKPMSEWKIVEAEIIKSFGEIDTPPLVFVEWSSGSRATEIELISAAPKTANPPGPISYFTPPGDKSSPVYSRVARVHGDEIVYLSAMTGPDANSADSEIRSLYAELERVAKAARSDLRHFAKATYYVSENDASQALNTLRPELYDPKRPPAASKVQVPGIGVKDRGMLIDMIAVPRMK